MNDQERITDLILSEKKMATNYNIFAAECTNVQLRDKFLQILDQSHKNSTDLFQQAQAKGWYQVEQAPMNKIQETYQKYSAQRP